MLVNAANAAIKPALSPPAGERRRLQMSAFGGKPDIGAALQNVR